MRSPLALGLADTLLCACAQNARIFTAIGSHDHEPTLELAEGGADLEARDEQGATPLMFAVFADNLEGARILLEHGADPNARRQKRSPRGSALFWAQGRPMIDLLLSHGTDLELRDEEERTALLWNAARGNLSTVRDLIVAGADVTARDYRGKEAKDAAASNLMHRPDSDIKLLLGLLRQAGAP